MSNTPFDVAVDAMGGDRAPDVPIEAALAAQAEGCRVVLVGDEALIRRTLYQHDKKHASIEIRHAPEVIGMDEKPSIAVRKKKGASVRVAAELVETGEAKTVVSAGNSGAVMAAGLFSVGRIRGVSRPALCAAMPTRKEPAVVVDLGANIDPTSVQLAQFAIMGEAYARSVLGRDRPKVALLTNGSEELKGTDLTRGAADLLSRSELNFIGYTEGTEIFDGDIDVIVTDGFTGNVALKTVEGLVLTVKRMVEAEIEGNLAAMAGALMLRKIFKKIAAKIDYERAGASPLLGLKGMVFVAHGSSTVRALTHAITGARALVETPLVEEIEKSIARHAELGLFKAAEGAAGSPAGAPIPGPT